MPTYKIGDKEYPITGYLNLEDEETGDPIGTFPIVDIPMVSDYQWQLDCLRSRLEHPELYEKSEDVPKTIEKIRKWLEEHKEEKSA